MTLSTRLLAGFCCFAMLFFAACQSEYVSVDPDNPRSPQYAYRHDQLALLTLTTDDILTLEKEKQYSRIFDHYASTQLKHTLGRRRFMKISNCVETHLGGLTSYDSNNLGFQRTIENGKPYDYIVKETERSEGSTTEKLIFVSEGVDFKLYGLSWETENRHFLSCLQDARKAAPDEAEIPLKQDTLPTKP